MLFSLSPYNGTMCETKDLIFSYEMVQGYLQLTLLFLEWGGRSKTKILHRPSTYFPNELEKLDTSRVQQVVLVICRKQGVHNVLEYTVLDQISVIEFVV